jgi:fluoroquinolone transport system permease protein
MQKYVIASKQFLNQLLKDAMLFICLIAPILASILLHFAVPIAEHELTVYFDKPSILSDYYILFDLLIALIAPMMSGFVSAMVMLSERDDKIISYMVITPLGGKGYIFSRLLLPSIVSFFYSILLLNIFSITKLGNIEIFLMALFQASQGIVIALIMTDISSNRVEGMAIGKLSSIIAIGMFIPFAIKSKIQYIGGILPGFWYGKYIQDGSWTYLVLSFIIIACWISILVTRFIKKSFQS